MSLRIKWKQNNGVYKTKTNTFLLAVFGYHKSFYTEYLIDCYIKSVNDYKLVLCFQNIENAGLQEQVYRICNHHGFDESYTDDNDKELVVVMSIDKEFHEDFQKFIEGRYSKFSDRLKDLLMKENIKATGKGHEVTVFDILYPTREKAQKIADFYGVELSNIPRELFDKPDLKTELYKGIEELNKDVSKQVRVE